MRRFSTESTVRRSSHDTRVDEAAMQAKMKELRGLMASEHAARETVLDMATLNGGSIWQTSRRPEERGREQPIRPSVGVSGGRGGRTAQPHRTGPRLRDLSAEDMSLVERARMRASTDANARPSSHASTSRRPDIPERRPGASRGSSRVRTSVDVLDHLRPDLIARTMGVVAQPMPTHTARTSAMPSSRAGGGISSGISSSTHGTRGGRPGSPRVEHVVLRSGDLRGQLGEGRLVPRPPPGGAAGGRPSSRSFEARRDGSGIAGAGIPATGAGAVRFGGLGAVPAMDLGMDEDLMASVEPVGGGARPRTGGRTRVEPMEWRSSKRDGADVLITADESSSSSHPSAKREDATNANVRTAGGVTIVNESGGALLDGSFDEDANRRAFAEALREWRSGGEEKNTELPEETSSDSPLVVRESTRPATAAAEMNVQTDGTGPKGLYVGAKKSGLPAGKSSKPIHTAKPGASYFERLFAKNVERMAGKKVSDQMRAK